MFKKEFDTSYVGFMKDGAQWLVDNTDIKLVGKIGQRSVSSFCYWVFQLWITLTFPANSTDNAKNSTKNFFLAMC